MQRMRSKLYVDGGRAGLALISDLQQGPFTQVDKAGYLAATLRLKSVARRNPQRAFSSSTLTLATVERSLQNYRLLLLL